MPEEFIAEGLLKSFASMNLTEKKILIPRAARARDILPEGLKKQGASVDVVTAYQTIQSDRKKEELSAHIDAGEVDVITFTSSSTVTNFVEIMGEGFIQPPHVKVACIGPVTADAAVKAGFRVDIRQEEYTMEGLVQSLVNYYQNEPKGRELL